MKTILIVTLALLICVAVAFTFFLPAVVNYRRDGEGGSWDESREGVQKSLRGSIFKQQQVSQQKHGMKSTVQASGKDAVGNALVYRNTDDDFWTSASGLLRQLGAANMLTNSILPVSVGEAPLLHWGMAHPGFLPLYTHVTPPRDYALSAVKPDDVDLVVFYGDVTHPRWEEHYAAHAQRHNQKYDRERFNTVGELGFMLRGATQNLQWVRRIVLVTTFGDAPPFLDPVKAANPPPGVPPIHILSNEDILPRDKAAAPQSKDQAWVSFDSNALQVCVGNIPGLAPWVLLSDDDCFALRPIPKDRWLGPPTPAYAKLLGLPETTPEKDLLSAQRSLPGWRFMMETLASPCVRPDVHVNASLARPTVQDLDVTQAGLVARSYGGRQSVGAQKKCLEAGDGHEGLGIWASTVCTNIQLFDEVLPQDVLKWVAEDDVHRGYGPPAHHMTLYPSSMWKLLQHHPRLSQVRDDTLTVPFRRRQNMTHYLLENLTRACGLQERHTGEMTKRWKYFSWAFKGRGRGQDVFLNIPSFPKEVELLCVNNFNGENGLQLLDALERHLPSPMWCERTCPMPSV